MKEKHVKREKGIMLIIAIALISQGIQAITLHYYASGIKLVLT